jgi:glutamyl-tRNA reductase
VINLIGISHKTAPIEVRERLAFSNEELLQKYSALQHQFGPNIVLSTCNRTETYFHSSSGRRDAADLMQFMAGARDVSAPADASHFYAFQGGDAVRHLFRVASGLESMVLGEAQILGQIRNALHTAHRAGASDHLLERLFQSAIAAGRRIRLGTGGSGSSASVSTAAVELARKARGDLSSMRVLIVSSGETAKLTAWNMARSGVERIVIAGRTLTRAESLARSLEASAVSMHDLENELAGADIVVTSTNSRAICIDPQTVKRAMICREERPLLMIDLAVPRDIDPEVRSIAGVTLCDIDDVQPLIDEGARGDRDLEVGIETEVTRFMAWWQHRSLAPTIAALRERAEEIRHTELAKTLGRRPGFTDEDRQRIEALTGAIVKKLLHEPIMALKDPDCPPDRIDAICELFALQTTPELN